MVSVPHHLIPGLITPINAALADKDLPWQAFPATVCNSRHADGRCVGIGLMPRFDQRSRTDDTVLSPPARRKEGEQAAAAVEHILVDHVERVLVDRSVPERRAVISPRALNPETWYGPTRQWFSVTPLRAFPDERVLRHQLNREIEERYGRRVAAVHMARTPDATYVSRWRTDGLLDGLDQWWGEIELDTEIGGPLMLGEAIDSGYGLFHPRTRS